MDTALALDFALYAREAGDLPSLDVRKWRAAQPWPPHYLRDLVPEEAKEQAAREWESWWGELVGKETAAPSVDVHTLIDPPEFGGLAGRPALRRLLRKAWPDFAGWWFMPTGPAQAIGLASMVTESKPVRSFMARPAGRMKRPFHLAVHVVYADCSDKERVGADHVVVGARPVVMAARLGPEEFVRLLAALVGDAGEKDLL